MAENLSIEAPDFDRIKQETGTSTRDGVKLLWTAMNYEMGRRRSEVRQVHDKLSPKVLDDAPAAQQDNYDLQGCSILMLSGVTGRTFTGFRAPSTNESHVLFIHVTGAGTYTMAHASASSDPENRMRLQSLANTTIATDRSMILMYIGDLWRELKLV
jgi:hypothetical protein